MASEGWMWVKTEDGFWVEVVKEHIYIVDQAMVLEEEQERLRKRPPSSPPPTPPPTRVYFATPPGSPLG